MRPIRLLQFVPEALPSFRSDVSVLFGKYLPRHGVHCDVVGKHGDGDADAQGFASASRPAPGGSRWRREFSFFRLCLAKLARASRRNCDVIQVRDMVSVGLAGLLLARLRGLPFCYWVSFLMSEGRIARARSELAARPQLHYYLVLLKGLVEREILYRVILPAADHVFVQSDAMKALMVQRGIAAAKMSAVPMGVDTEKVGAGSIVAQHVPGWAQRPVVAYLGTLDRARALDQLLDAVQLLRRHVPDAGLLLIGASATAADLDFLLRHADAIGLPRDALHVTGWLPSAQALALLAGAQLAISYIPRGPLLDISSPTKLLEYLALATPAIGNDNPDQAYVLDASQAGWLTDSTPASLAGAMQAVLSDLPGAQARAAAGPGFIEQQRSYRVLAEQVAQRYYRLLAGA